jgi:replicative DNA helicase
VASEHRVQEIGEISMGLKAIARNCKSPQSPCPSTMRRWKPRDKRPQLSDLRESGSIRQDADVMFVYRGGYYTEREEETATWSMAA